MKYYKHRLQGTYKHNNTTPLSRFIEGISIIVLGCIIAWLFIEGL